MADVTGPIKSLPGSFHKVPAGMTCDNPWNYHSEEKLATHRVQGETDSFGSEMTDMCDECFAKCVEEEKNADTSGTCDWCKRSKPVLTPHRDYEEGSAGPVYYVCGDCIHKESIRISKELDEVYADSYDNYADDDSEGCSDSN